MEDSQAELWEHPDARVDMLVLQASRDEVEADNVAPALAKLSRLLLPTNARRLRGRLVFEITGYLDDPRDLWEFPEVVAWMRKLDIEWPYWFYFMDTGPNSTMSLVTFSLCNWDKIPGGKAVPPEELQRFLVRHFAAMNELSRHLGESQEENDARSREIKAHFFPEQCRPKDGR